MIEVEEIPGKDLLYHRLHKNFFKNQPEDNKFIRPGAIKNTGNANPPGMSTDWAKYSTPAETRNRGAQSPDKYEVIKMIVGDVRKIPEQSVRHTPSNNNDAHTTIFGPKDSNHPEYRIMFTRVATLLQEID